MAGEQTVGVYPLLPDDTCHFLAVDFDKQEWRDDARAFLNSCRTLGIPAALEISRSGNGAHAWIFFSHKVDAREARRLGTAIISHVCTQTRQLELGSYDRLFPNQDTMPKGGFGNLIALPLQKKPRESNCSVFVDDELRPYPDQWAFLASVQRMPVADIEPTIFRATGGSHPLDVTFVEDEDNATPWKKAQIEGKKLPGRMPKQLNITLANLVYSQKDELPQTLANRLIRLAAFQNPEFYKAQAMRFIVDECHHIGAVSFDLLLRRAKAKYILGLTATPIRRDGQQPIIFMQCGPIRHTAERPESAPHFLEVYPRNLLKRIDLPPEAGIQDVFRHLANDSDRTQAVCRDVVDNYRQGRKVLVLTERTDHLDMLATELLSEIPGLFLLHGRMSKKQRTAITTELDKLPHDAPRVLLATGKLVGEGFDHSALDTLILAMPVSWKGTLQQYAGRLHREHSTKTNVRIFDYVDTGHPALNRMWEKRLRGYRAMGYGVVTQGSEQARPLR